MRELTYYIAVTLDGRIADPDHGFAAIPVEGDHIEMILRDYTDTLPALGLEATGLTPSLTRFDTILMGWNTYAAGLPFGAVNPYPHLRQYVFSRTHAADEVPAEVTLTAEDPVEVVRRLKAEPEGSGVYLCGGGRLASTLFDEIDRLVLKVNPLVFGAGIPLFDGAYAPTAFELTASTPYRSGVVVNEYRRAA